MARSARRSTLGRPSTPTTGVELQKRFFDHFLKGDRQRLGQAAARCSCRCAILARSSSLRHENEWPLARTQWTQLPSRPGRDAPVRGAGEREQAISYEAMGDGVTFSTPPLERETEITGPSALKLFVSSSTTDADIFAVLRVFDPKGKEVSSRARSTRRRRSARAGCAPRTASSIPKRSLPYRPFHTHDEKQPLVPGRDLRARRRDLADLHRRAQGLARRAHDPRQGLRI